MDGALAHFFLKLSKSWNNLNSFLLHTGWISEIWKEVQAKILKEPLVLLKQTIHQQKVLDLSFNLAPWKWAWHYHEAVTPSCPKITFFTPRGPMLFAARGRGALLIMPRPLLGCQIKAEIKGFLLMYRLFLYYQWFSQNIEKGWRKIFEKRLFPRFLKMTKIIKNISSSVFPFSEKTITSTETNVTSAESPWSQL